MTKKITKAVDLSAAPTAANWPPKSLTKPSDPHFKWARVCMFDLHGVVFDWENAFNHFVGKHYGFTFDTATRQYYDIGRDPTTPINPKQFGEAFQAFARRGVDGYGELQPFAGIIEQMELIAAAGIQVVICTYTPGANDVRPDGSATFQTGIARLATQELIAKHLGHIVTPQNIIYSHTGAKKYVMLESRIPVIVEDKAATAVDVAESALGAILIPHPYNDVKFPNVLRLENSNQLADAVISLFEAIDDNGALSA